MTDTTITRVHGRRVWDSRGRPTVEVEVQLGGGVTGRAIAPAGASRGSNEAMDLRDGGTVFGGMGVTKAIGHVNNEISRLLIGRNSLRQAEIDDELIALDGTPGKSRLAATP
jgi:enolase